MNHDIDIFSASKTLGVEGFVYKELFGLNNPAWMALDNLISFFKKFSFNNESKIFIGKSSKVDPGAKIEGPCVIGEGCEIRFGAYIRSGTLIGNDCVVGHSSEITRSILLNGAKVPHFNYIGDSIIGSNVNMGAGSKCANVRLDRKEIEIAYQGKSFKTNRKKLGSIIGKDASIGCNAVLNPGTIVLPGSVVLPCCAVKGVIE